MITKGKCEIDLYGQSQCSNAIHVGPLGYVDGVAAVLFYDGKEQEQKDNADLICEAFNVYNETGFTPKELVEQKADLLDVLKAISNVSRADMCDECKLPCGCFDFRCAGTVARSAIAKATN